MSRSKPHIFTTPFAAEGEKTIPTDAPVAQGRASLTQGFPVETQLPVRAGGIPPDRTDFNGILNLESQHTVHQIYGGGYTFEAKVAEAGGYPMGAVLRLADETFPSFVYSTKDDNTDDFNADASYIGTSWVMITPRPGPDGTYLGSQDGKTQWLPWPFGQAVADDVIWYVRPDGNDDAAKKIVSADMHGSQNTAAAAFKTVAAAAAFFTSNYYITGKGTITIQLGATGTYTEPSWVNLPAVSSLALESLPPPSQGWRARARYTIAGDKNNKGAYVWSMASDPSLSAYAAYIGNWSYEGLSIVTTGTRTTYGVNFVGGGRLWNTNVTSPAASLVVGNTAFSIVGNCTITGNGGAATAFHGSSSACAIVFGDGATSEAATVITLNCPTAGSSSIGIHTFARVSLYDSATIAGTVNGAKYSASSLSLIATGGRLATIPGTAAGGVFDGSIAN